MTDASVVTLVAATAWHAAFQVTVTAVVYPMLARWSAEELARHHAPYTRSVTGVVAVTYAGLGIACLWALLDDPGSVWTWLTGVFAALTVVVTGTLAAPIHGRLGRVHDPALVTRLLRVDRVRAVLGLAALACAVLLAVSG